MSEPIFMIEDGDFEWCAFAVYPHPVVAGKYATWQDQGCSCDSYEAPSELELRALEPVDRATARTEMLAFCRHYDYWINAGDTIRYTEEFEHALREAAA